MKKSLLGICIALCIVSCQSESESVNPVDQWTSIPSYPSKQAREMVLLQDTLIVADTSSPATFYTGTKSGSTWNTIHAPFGNVTLLVNYAGGVYATTSADGIYYSSDLCRSWVQKNNGLPGNFNVTDVVVANGGLYACGAGLYYSNDTGNNWTNISIPNANQVLSVFYLDHTLIASTNAGLYNSVDNGKTWNALSSSSGISDASIDKFAIIDNAIYACSSTGTTSAIYASYDKGNNWIKSKGLDISGVNTFYGFAFFQGSLYVASVHGVFNSVDNGKNWVYSGCDHAVSLVQKDNVLFAGTASQGISEATLKFQYYY